MKVERYALIGTVVAFAVGVTAAILSRAPGNGRVHPPGHQVLPVVSGPTLVAALLWATTVTFGLGALLWILLTYVVGAGYEPPANEYAGDEVQVRILTVDAESVVQATVDSLPAELDDVLVIAETDVDVTGAQVHVVPDEFECAAVRKGRAIEWARQHLPNDREFTLYLDEDSQVEQFDGLPDADVVQLQERPRRTGSVLTYLADVYRMGVQAEQRAFARLGIPLFAWGGGVAVRSDLEDEVTWNRNTIVEDTAFVWAAARDHPVDFALADAVCRNEAPPSLYEILQQRRRWAAGNLRAASMLPLHYRILTRLRTFTWALGPVVTVIVFPLSLLGIAVVQSGPYVTASLAIALFMVGWYLLGLRRYGWHGARWIVAVPLAPLVTVVHSAGTVAGILTPPEEFRVTKKAGTRK